MKAKLLSTFAVAGVSFGLIQGASGASIVVAAFYNFGYTANAENYPPTPTSTNLPPHADNPNYFASGFSGGVTKGKASWDIGGSSDADLGDLDTGVFTVPQVQGGDGHLRVGVDSKNEGAVIRVSNSSGITYDLDTLYFDASADIVTQSVLVEWSYDNVSYNPLTQTLDVLVDTSSGGHEDYGDYSGSLSGVTLASGQSIYFKFTLNTNNTARIDQIGLTAIPEASSVLVLGSMLGAALAFRRRQRA